MYRRSSFAYYETYYKKEGLKTEAYAEAYSNKCLESGRCDGTVIGINLQTGEYYVKCQRKRVWYE